MTCPAWVDTKFRVHVVLWTVLSALAYGLVAAIIPNPVFARQIAPEGFAVAVWLVSAPLMGVMGATYSSPWLGAPLARFGPPAVGSGSADGSGSGAGSGSRAVDGYGSGAGSGSAADLGVPIRLPGQAVAALPDDERTTWLGGVASFGAFLAIGCPVCNKLALLLLGTSGALSIWAPIQPVLGALSLTLLAATVVWRLRLRASGATCAV